MAPSQMIDHFQMIWPGISKIQQTQLPTAQPLLETLR